jgi:hypothetical protein
MCFGSKPMALALPLRLIASSPWYAMVSASWFASVGPAHRTGLSTGAVLSLSNGPSRIRSESAQYAWSAQPCGCPIRSPSPIRLLASRRLNGRPRSNDWHALRLMWRISYVAGSPPTAPCSRSSAAAGWCAHTGRRLGQGAAFFLGHADEPNPALGVGGIRTAAIYPQLLHDQLRAIKEAAEAESAELWVMAPMITTVAELRSFSQAVREAGLPTIGIMIETPAAALEAEQVLTEVDFVSIGTNDLAQYAFAADRHSADLAH